MDQHRLLKVEGYCDDADHTQLKSVYGVSRVTCPREPGPPIFMSKIRGPGVEATQPKIKRDPSRFLSNLARSEYL